MTSDGFMKRVRLRRPGEGVQSSAKISVGIPLEKPDVQMRSRKRDDRSGAAALRIRF